MKTMFLGLLLIPLFSFSQVSNNNQKVVSDYFNFLFKKGDFVSLQKIITENAMYKQADGLPYGGTYKGFSEWMKMFEKVQTYFELHLYKEPILFSNEKENKVIANFTIEIKSKTSGKVLAMNIMELSEIKEGMIVSVTPYYFDTKSVADLANEK